MYVLTCIKVYINIQVFAETTYSMTTSVKENKLISVVLLFLNIIYSYGNKCQEFNIHSSRNIFRSMTLAVFTLTRKLLL